MTNSIFWTIRVVASQCIAALPLNILQFTCGSFIGLTTILASEKGDISMGSTETILFVNYCYMQPIGYIIGGVLAHYFGSRKIIMAADVIFLCSWLLFRSTTTAGMLLFAQTIVGLMTGIIAGPSYTYLAEITQPLFRNTLMASLDLSILLGTLFFVLMTQIMYWKDIILINVAFPIVGISIMYFVPESPYWLANKNYYNRVENSLSWFRGWKNGDNVQTEGFQIISNSKRSSKTLKLFCQRSFYIPLIIISFILCIDTCGGSQTLLLHFATVMEELKSPIGKSSANVIIMTGRTVCAIFFILSIHIAGKRLLMFFSLVAGSILLVIASIFGFLVIHDQVTAEGFFWVPSIALLAAIFILTAGIENVSLILNSEIFPSKLRQIGAGVGFFVRYMMLLIVQTTFFKTFDVVTVPGTFLIFAFINIIGFIILYCTFPETGNRSLIEIEEIYVGTKNVKIENRNISQTT